MIPHSRFEALYEKVGGVYKTTVLIQKRLRELQRGARRLVDDPNASHMEIAMREIMEGKIELVPDTAENRDLLRAEVERMTSAQPAPFEVGEGEASSEEELERRILSALKQRTGPE